MEAWMPQETRRVVARQRRKPDQGRVVLLPFEDGYEAAFADPATPAQLLVEATDCTAETAVWLDDYFWMDAIKKWATDPLAVVFLPTYESLLHPVIGYQIEMLRRVAPQWRLIGYCYLSDLEVEGRIARAAMTLYHEIRIIDGRRPGSPENAHPLRIEDAIAKMRQVQAAADRTNPVLARCRMEDAPVGSEMICYQQPEVSSVPVVS